MAVDVRTSRADLIRALLKIDNKRGIVVPFALNPVQEYFQRHKSNRNIIIKARQVGISSSILADMYIDCISVLHASCAVVSHETRSTQRLLDRVQFYYDGMDEPKPRIGAESRSEKTFPEMHSSIYIGTAGGRAFGRGDTIRKALASELAWWEDGERILTGIEDAVPIFGELTIETTPNGEDNIAYEKWVRAREGKSPYRPFFFPWWLDKDYAIPRGSGLALPEDIGELSLTGEELELTEKHHVSEDQIRWRRWKIGEKGGLFWQEYPEDELTCFYSVGDPVFDPFVLTNLAQNCYEGTRHEQGWMFWLPPVEKGNYIIAADSSAGVPGGSFSAAVVLSDAYEVVATFQARIEPHTFAGILKSLGLWYNRALLVVERNFTGYAVLSHMQDYPNIYYQRDFVTGKISTNRGWWTNEQTTEYMRTVLKDRLGQLKIWDINLIRQLRGYRYIRLRPTAQTFNDLAISLMIGCAVKKVEGVARGYMGNVQGWSW